MSADAKMVPVAWHIGPIFKLGSEKPGRFGADDSRWQPLYSADTIAALRKDAERYRFVRDGLLSPRDVFDTTWLMERGALNDLDAAVDAAIASHAAIDAAQPSEKK